MTGTKRLDALTAQRNAIAREVIEGLSAMPREIERLRKENRDMREAINAMRNVLNKIVEVAGKASSEERFGEDVSELMDEIALSLAVAKDL